MSLVKLVFASTSALKPMPVLLFLCSITLSKPKNALVNQYIHLFEIDDVELSFRDEALKQIAKQAIKRKTGARGLRSIMEDILMDTMFNLPNADLEKVIIDEKTVISKTEPIKLLKTNSKKTSSGN